MRFCFPERQRPRWMVFASAHLDVALYVFGLWCLQVG